MERLKETKFNKRYLNILNFYNIKNRYICDS